jgi:hypothetical protein
MSVACIATAFVIAVPHVFYYLGRIANIGEGRKEFSSGVDVMITIFRDFRTFSAKKLAVFSKTNVMIQFLRKHILNINC